MLCFGCYEKPRGHLTTSPRDGGDTPSPLLALLETEPILQSMPMGVVIRDAQGRVIDCNAQAEMILGVARDQVIDRATDDPTWHIIREDGTDFPFEEQPSQLTRATGQPCSEIIMGISFSHRSYQWVMTSTAPLTLGDESRGTISTFFDVTPRLGSRRILRLMAEANRIIVSSNDEGECLQQLCDVLVRVGHFQLVWVALEAPSLGAPSPVSFSAGVVDYLDGRSDEWWEVLGITTEMASREIHVVNDFAPETGAEAQLARLRRFDLRSALVLPLNLGAHDAHIVIYENVTGGFDQTLIVGLHQVIREIEFGLRHIRSRREITDTLKDLTSANHALRVAEQTLAESEQWFRQLLANSSDLIVVLDEHARVLYANPANARFSGYDADTRLGGDGFAHLHPDDYDVAFKAFEGAVHNTVIGEPVVLRFLTASGEWQFLECVLANCLDDPAIKGIIVNARDVTDRTHLARALHTLTSGSQILVSASDEASLIDDTCHTIVTSGEFPLACVALINPADANVRVVGCAGLTQYLESSPAEWGETDVTIEPTLAAVRLAQIQVVADIRASDWPAHDRERAERFGLRTVCAFPLWIHDDVIGALTIFSHEEKAFGNEELSLLGELAKYLGYGLGRIRDATQLHESTTLLTESERRFRIAFESNMAPMVFSDLDDLAISVNDAFCRMIGYSREELIGRDSRHFTYPADVEITDETISHLREDDADQARYTKRYLRKDGRLIISEVSRSLARDESGRPLYYVSSEREVTEERALADQLSHQALHDPLTGLANRVLFEDRLVQARARTARQGSWAAVLLLDLDNFSEINDSHGHLVGDQLLIQITRRFHDVTRASDTLGRFGGDEFLYLAEDLTSPAEAEAVATRLLDTLAEPFSLNDVHFEQRASAGVVVWDSSSEMTDDLIQNADVALYEAKHGGKGRFMVFTPRMHQEVVGRFTLVQELRLALQSGQLAMHYQPLVDLATATIVGFEALMRWHHPQRGWVSPDIFIPLAEQSDLILELGAFALSTSVAAAVSWPTARKGTLKPFVTVNLSARQFQDPELTTRIEDLLRSSGLAPERLIIEITESVTLVDTVETLTTVERLADLGVAIALDDFGTGYSSLSYLVRLRPRVIKIDQYFVSSPSDSSYNDALLEAIISLGNRLDMTMLAEGIETLEQFHRLRGLRCSLGQGYLFSPAIPETQVRSLLKTKFPIYDDLAVKSKRVKGRR